MSDNTPSLEYLESILSTVSRINNGRHVHKRDSCRQSLTFFINFMKNNVELNDRP